MGMRLVLSAAFLGLLSALVPAQQAPRFEVASIRSASIAGTLAEIEVAPAAEARP